MFKLEDKGSNLQEKWFKLGGSRYLPLLRLAPVKYFTASRFRVYPKIFIS